ncbi:unnamed protein product [Clonostachys rhizophaga]|uniref:Pal1-like protein n=1 Tax=Clonostachys rhizophaga TaxID=160324 RepID=A0A9N9VM89_9HYPO|nr:unnamed protein product [Clonostachys rhizophaga]
MAARSRWVTGNLSYRDRSFRVLVSPTPVTFAERRSILQVLEQHGPIEVFKRTPDYHANFISVAKTPETASKLLAASPMTYTLEQGDSPDLSFSDLAQPRRLDGTKPTINASRSGVNQAVTSEERRTFQINIYAERDYNHAGTFANTQLHQSWPKNLAQGETFMSSTLAQSLPNNVAKAGLSRWDGDADTRTPIPKITSRRTTSNWVPRKIQHAAEEINAQRQLKAKLSGGARRATRSSSPTGNTPDKGNESPGGPRSLPTTHQSAHLDT